MTRNDLNLMRRAFAKGVASGMAFTSGELSRGWLDDILALGIEIGEHRGKSLRVERYAQKRQRRHP